MGTTSQADPEAKLNATSATVTIERNHSDKPISISEPPTKKRKRLSKELPSQREEFESGAKRGKDSELDWRNKGTFIPPQVLVLVLLKISTYITASEARRLNRIKHKSSETTCFACREKGHAAKECPKTKNDGQGKSKVGICYR